jgi:UDP-N-acetylglucosamine 2-epimerase (non-hydrolysing)
MFKVLVIFGTRPEAIKMAPIVKALHATEGIECQVAVSAQHREMLDQVLELFQIEPNYDLNIMKPGQSLSEVLSGVLLGLEDVLGCYEPNLVLVHGDTSTTLSASLAAYYKRIPVGHVEAGLRTGNMYSPWPEEMNRKVAGAIARLHFAPTEQSRANLLSENVPDAHIYVTGNSVIDALLDAVGILANDATKCAEFDRAFHINQGSKIILVTGHRRESFGDGFARVCDALVELAKREDVQIIYPVHPNPAVRVVVEARLGGIERITLIPPQEYLPFVHLMQRAHLILTDSGGVQEEAPSLGKPVLVMRDTTERPEAVTVGTVKLVGTDPAKIIAEVTRLIDDVAYFDSIANAHNPYGDGNTAARIVGVIQSFRKEAENGTPQ